MDINLFSWSAFLLVPDLTSRIHDFVLGVYLVQENPGGSGIWNGREWGGDGEGKVSLRATWDQGGWDPIMPRRVSKEVKEKWD
jgi:hypothetical protein